MNKEFNLTLCQQWQGGFTFSVNLDYATSGVGCTARSAFDAYRALPQMNEREIAIQPVSKLEWISYTISDNVVWEYSYF